MSIEVRGWVAVVWLISAEFGWGCAGAIIGSFTGVNAYIAAMAAMGVFTLSATLIAVLEERRG